MPVPAAQGLADFGATAGKALVPAAEDQAETPTTAAEDASTNASRVEDHEGLAELEALREEFDARLRDEVARARRAWADEQGGLSGDEVAAQFATVQASLRDWMGRTAEVMLEAPARERALNELHGVIAQMINRAVAVKAYGPQDLLQALRARLDGEVTNLTCTQQEHGELRVEVDRTIVETTVGAWLESWRHETT